MRIISDQELEELLAKSPAERITKEQIAARIVSVEYLRVGQTVTVCSIKIDNGFSVRGESACVNVANYN